MTSICSICVNNVCESRNVVCGFCQFSACMSCYETYLLSQDTAHCMNNDCKREWTRHFLSAHFTKTFLNGKLKKHREHILFESEKSLLPATQLVIEDKKRVAIIKEKIARYSAIFEASVVKQKTDKACLKSMAERCEFDKEYEKKVDLKTKNQIYKTNTVKHNKLERDWRNIRIRLEDELNAKKVGVSVKKFIRACPVAECRGFLDDKWKCGLCNHYTCSACLVVKGPNKEIEHTCNPDDVATATLIASDTKPCPSCQEGIFKIVGCDHMFCTKCHTAFSWKTGEIQTHTSNPHYWEFIRQRDGAVPRDPHDHHECDAPIRRNVLESLIRMLDNAKMPDAYVKQISKVIETYTHILGINLPRYRTDHFVNNEALRIKFMLNEITETQFKWKLLQAKKAFDKKKEIFQILTTFTTAMSDILNNFRIKITGRNATEIESMCPLAEISALVAYVNELFKEVAEVYDTENHLMIVLRTVGAQRWLREDILITVKRPTTTPPTTTTNTATKKAKLPKMAPTNRGVNV